MPPVVRQLVGSGLVPRHIARPGGCRFGADHNQQQAAASCARRRAAGRHRPGGGPGAARVQGAFRWWVRRGTALLLTRPPARRARGLLVPRSASAGGGRCVMLPQFKHETPVRYIFTLFVPVLLADSVAASRKSGIAGNAYFYDSASRRSALPGASGASRARVRRDRTRRPRRKNENPFLFAGGRPRHKHENAP